MRKFYKFAHTIGAIGLMGGMLCLLVILYSLPQPSADPQGFLRSTDVADSIARIILLPSLGVTLVSGLLAIGANPALHNAGWAWFKLATGILLFEGGLVTVQGPIQRAAMVTEEVVNAGGELAALAGVYGSAKGSIIVLIGVAVVNVVLGVWRPKFGRRRQQTSAEILEK